MGKRDDAIDRRQILRLAGVGGATALLPSVAASCSATSQKSSTSYEDLGELVKPMTKLDATGRRMRKAFDEKPSQMIEGAKLDNSDWRAFVSMDGGQIYAAVWDEEPPADKAAWEQRWDTFTGGWKECTDGYKVPSSYPDCPRACEGDDSLRVRYAGPRPTIDRLDYQNGKVYGEGFLNGAVILIFDRGADPVFEKPIKSIMSGVSIAGTFRCSVATFTPVALSPGKYDFYVVNRYKRPVGTYDNRLVFRVGPTDLDIS